MKKEQLVARLVADGVGKRNQGKDSTDTQSVEPI